VRCDEKREWRERKKEKTLVEKKVSSIAARELRYFLLRLGAENTELLNRCICDAMRRSVLPTPNHKTSARFLRLPGKTVSYTSFSSFTFLIHFIYTQLSIIF